MCDSISPSKADSSNSLIRGVNMPSLPVNGWPDFNCSKASDLKSLKLKFDRSIFLLFIFTSLNMLKIITKLKR